MSNPSEINSSISNGIWANKYALRDTAGIITEKDWSSTVDRCTKALSGSPTFHSALLNKEFLPAGRILLGAGSPYNLTLFNCFVMGRMEDSLTGIFKTLSESAQSLKYGGGIGVDFSTLRPKGDSVKGSGAQASGPVSFMHIWNSMCQTIMSAGVRRGAMMATLRVDHPDIMDFIESKRTHGALTNFNISVLITDEFMKNIKDNREQILTFNGEPYASVPAQKIWDAIMTNTYKYSEPGVIFIDTVNVENPNKANETITCTNPCGEQPLPHYGACLLGSFNLAKFVRSPFNKPWFDFVHLNTIIPDVYEAMNRVVDVSKYPLEEFAVEERKTRRMGIGVTGLADMFAMLNLKYGSEASINIMSQILNNIKSKLEKASAGRNTHLTSIAPTGTISMLAGNVSSGIEPFFSLEFDRKVRLQTAIPTTIKLRPYAVELYLQMFPEPTLDSLKSDPRFITSDQVPLKDHLTIQAIAQRWVDSAVSKTINCPSSITYDEFKDVYLEAYNLGLKGCTTFRPSEVRQSILSTPSEPTQQLSLASTASVAPITSDVPPPRPHYLTGGTYKLKPDNSRPAYYITINYSDSGAPLEIFINTKDVSSQSWIIALTRMLSALFRKGGDISFILEELSAIHDPTGGMWHNKTYYPSLVAAISSLIQTRTIPSASIIPSASLMSHPDVLCPNCQRADGWIPREGCEYCMNCGYSTC